MGGFNKGWREQTLQHLWSVDVFTYGYLYTPFAYLASRSGGEVVGGGGVWSFPQTYII